MISNETCKYFDEPLELLECVTHHLHDIIVSDEAIEIQYAPGVLKKIIKTVSFKLAKAEIDPSEELKLKIDKMKT